MAMRWSIPRSLAHFFGRISQQASPPVETDSKIVSIEEAAAKRHPKVTIPQSLSMAWDEDAGLPGYRNRDGGLLRERDRKDTYYQVYLTNPWVRGCVHSIAKRFTSGKWELTEIERGKGSLANYDKLYTLLSFVNEDEDFKQLLRSIAEDLGIFGESFVEIVYQNGVPAALYKIDCISMSVRYDKHGRVIGYFQELDHSTETAKFEPDQIIRWWFPDPRANKKALSPIECIKDASYLYTSMITWGEKFFKQGGKPSYSVEMGPDANEDDAKTYLKWYKENYTGIQNAHVPPIFYGGSKLVEFGKGSVELDYLKSLAWCRDEILAAYNSPLSIIGIQETAHLGGGSGESANKIYLYNTVKPIEELILEKLNYRICARGFNISDWVVTMTHADYRDDKDIADIQDKQIRNGTLLINEAREERGHLPVDGGDTAIFTAGRDIQPVEVLAELADEHRQQISLSQQGAQQALQQSNNGDKDGQDQTETPGAKGKAAKDDKEAESERSYPGSSQGLRYSDGINAAQFNSRMQDNANSEQRRLYDEGQRRGVLCLSK